MKCSYHPTVESVHNCHTCGKLLCEACSHRVRGNVYCQDCLVQGAEWSAAVRDLRIPKDAAKRAALLALIPGMGAVYNGQYFKAVAYLVTFVSLSFAGSEIHGVFRLAAFSFYIFMIFDAYRTAEEIQSLRLRREEVANVGKPGDLTSPVWGFLLIVLGLFLTMFNFDIITPELFRKLWPLVVILIGLFLVYRGRAADKHRIEVPKTTSEERKENPL